MNIELEEKLVAQTERAFTKMQSHEPDSDIFHDLSEEIRKNFEILNKIDKTGQEQSEAWDKLVHEEKLKEMELESKKLEREFELKLKELELEAKKADREMEQMFRERELESKKKDRRKDIVMGALSITVPALITGGIYLFCFSQGLQFEEHGAVTSTFFRNLANRIKL